MAAALSGVRVAPAALRAPGARRRMPGRCSAAEGAGGAGAGAGAPSGGATSPPSTPKKKTGRNRSVLEGDEYIWNTNWEFELERDEKGTMRAIERDEVARKQSAGGGAGLGLSRLGQMDDMNVDLSAELAKPRKPLVEKRPRTQIDKATTDRDPGKYDLVGWNYAPTRAEKARWAAEWAKAQKYQDGSVPVKQYKPSDVRDAPGRPLTEEEKAARARDAADDFQGMQEDLLLTTAGISGAGAALAYALGGVDAAASFAFGAGGSLWYIRLLGRKAESFGKGAGGPPSILVPVILFMAFNRWNTLAAPSVGHTLQALPILLGFFTYKPTTVIQAFKDILKEADD